MRRRGRGKDVLKKSTDKRNKKKTEIKEKKRERKLFSKESNEVGKRRK